MRKSVLKEMRDCSGCGLCEAICPKHAIQMQYNKWGFLYPNIDTNKCIDCGLCEKKCVINNFSVTTPVKCYAGINLNDETREKSSSGGIFAALAEEVLEEGGAVFGAAVVPKGNIVTVEHVCAHNKDELQAIQGSKYVQSNARAIYPEVERKLATGKKVLFSGTPCQVSAIKNYLGQSYDNLLLVDLICHGTPSALYWKQSLKEKIRGKEKITSLTFRSSKGYMQGEIEFSSDGIHTRKEDYNFKNDLYYSFFLSGDIYREGCYQCKYARPERVSDITLGDFWGFEKEYDQEKIEKEAGVSFANGNSVVIVNSGKGLEACERLRDRKAYFYQVDYQKAVQHNAQLRHPSNMKRKRQLLLLLYRLGQWKLISALGKMKNAVKTGR